MKNIELKDNNFVELSTSEACEINGGEGILLTIVIAGLTTVACGLINAAVEKNTGKGVGEHIADFVGSAAKTTGEALQSFGKWVSGE